AASVAIVVAAGCSRPEFRYVKNTEAHAYFKVPYGWKGFTSDEIRKETQRQALTKASPEALEAEKLVVWQQGFDGSKPPSVSHVVGISKAPSLEVRVRKLQAGERDQVSLAALRNLVVPIDQLSQPTDPSDPSASDNSGFELLDQEEITHDGLRGIRVVFNIRGSDKPLYTIDQTALIDAKAAHLYLFVLQADAQRYFNDRSLLHEIVSSFTVKQKG